MLHIFIDADACPVKQEAYRVASRYHLKVTLVANSWMRIPKEPWLELKVVGDGFDEADDWIVEHGDYGGYPACQPLLEGRGKGCGANWEAVQG